MMDYRQKRLLAEQRIKQFLSMETEKFIEKTINDVCTIKSLWHSCFCKVDIREGNSKTSTYKGSIIFNTNSEYIVLNECSEALHAGIVGILESLGFTEIESGKIGGVYYNKNNKED